MLALFRKFANTWIGKILMGLMTLGLAGFGISNVISTLGTNTIATVGGEEISIRDFQNAYQQQVQQFSQQIGRVPTAEEAAAVGIPGFVIRRLGSEAAMNELGVNLGLGISDNRLSDMLKSDPNFADALGGFDRSKFARILQQTGLTEAEYFEVQRKSARREQIETGLLSGTPAPEVAIDLINHFTGDTRTVDYFVLNADILLAVDTPSEDDLAAYLKDHQTEFRTSETRTVDMLALSPDVIAATKTIPEDEITAEYDRTKDSRVKIETRTIKQIALTTPELEKLFVDGKAAGKGIAELLTTSGLAFTELGTLTKAQITDASLADTAFGLTVDDYAIIEGIGGKRVVTVSAIEPGSQVTLAEAHDEIAKQLALAAARNEFTDVLDQIEELREAFRPLSEIADRFGLKPTTLGVTSTGAELAALPAIPDTERGRVAGAIFDAEQGELDPTITLGSNLSVWFDLKTVDISRDQTLAEVHDAVLAAWTKEKTEAALVAQVDKTMANLKSGLPFADVAVGLNQFLKQSPPLKRTGDGTPVFNDKVASAVFNGGPDHFGYAKNGDGDFVFFQVKEIASAAAPPAQILSIVQNGTRSSLYQDFVSAITADAGLTTNTQVLDRVLALNPTAQ